VDDASVHFRTVTFGNPNVSTFGTQGVCLDVEMPRKAGVFLIVNGKEAEVTLARLMEGARSGYLDEANTSPAWRLHRAPSPREFLWKLHLEDVQGEGTGRDFYYIRVRQTNNQWAWSSPIFTGIGQSDQG
ncbi:MAG TPA: hypothetical protein VMX75_07540, partial [Spirochaetia bacterium]|nr:hypothetical protein [Spirochaetia bacterium]